MAEHTPPEHGPANPDNPDVRHETRDVNVRGVIWFLVGLGALLLVVHFALTGLYALLVRQEEKAQPKLSPLQAKERPQFPRNLGKIPSPRLQVYEVPDMDARQREDAVLDTYGWVDRKAGVVRIPISRALELLADPATAAAHGLGAREQPKADAGGGR